MGRGKPCKAKLVIRGAAPTGTWATRGCSAAAAHCSHRRRAITRKGGIAARIEAQIGLADRDRHFSVARIGIAGGDRHPIPPTWAMRDRQHHSLPVRFGLAGAGEGVADLLAIFLIGRGRPIPEGTQLTRAGLSRLLGRRSRALLRQGGQGKQHEAKRQKTNEARHTP